MARNKRRRRNKWQVLALIAATIACGAVIFALQQNSKQPVAVTKSSPSQTKKTTKPAPKPPLVNVQTILNSWSTRQSGTASVMVYDLANDKYVGQLNPDTQYFTASIYKIFVAYVGYQKIADGTYSLKDPYLPGYNRGQCLDAMIRQSYSPCGETWWNELGKDKLTSKMKTYGLANTSLVALETSAKDVSIILRRLYNSDDLSEKYRGLFLDSMLNQPTKYRLGLPKGFSHSTVYNKVGWNGDLEYHDTAIVTLPNKRSYVVCILTSGVGTTNIVSLSQALEAKLSK